MEEISKKIMTPFSECEHCGYKNGFHVVLEPIKFSEQVHVKLKCPNCSQIYDIGWRTQLQR